MKNNDANKEQLARLTAYRDAMKKQQKIQRAIHPEIKSGDSGAKKKEKPDK